MSAVVTNIVGRLLMKDERAQFARVASMLRITPGCVMPTVLLETERVLRRLYKLPTHAVARALRGPVGLAELYIEAEDSIVQALDWFEQDMYFADALHLASARRCVGLATFDRDFIRAAARIGAGNVAEP